jgi:hypothetical protein
MMFLFKSEHLFKASHLKIEFVFSLYNRFYYMLRRKYFFFSLIGKIETIYLLKIEKRAIILRSGGRSVVMRSMKMEIVV